MNSLFEIYSSLAEYTNSLPDEFGRSRVYSTKNPDVFSPLVSECIYEKGFRPYYPDGKKFAVCISHDIDQLYLKQTFGRKLINGTRNLVNGKSDLGAYYMRSLARPEVFPEYDLNKMIALDSSYGIRSSYYFLALEEGEQDHNYHIEKIQDQIHAVASHQCEVALHGGHQAYNHLENLVSEKKKLEKIIGASLQGYRSHYLRFSIPNTWNNLAHAGFLYDSTFGFPDCVGFRNGMCYPHYPFDVLKNRFLPIIELPLIVMDATIFYYMRLDESAALKICLELIEKIKAIGGVFTLLWHNNFINGTMGGVYRKLLDLLKQQDPWFATSKELVTWWQNEHLLQQSQSIVNDFYENRFTEAEPS